jgi:hypothetical protein
MRLRGLEERLAAKRLARRGARVNRDEDERGQEER